jgi:hypothetical protein
MLLLDDVRRVVEALASAVQAPRRSSDPAQAVLGAIARRADARTAMARVPEVVKALEGQLEPAEAIAALLALHQQGRVELRPEAGVGLLTEQDAALCPRGARGVVLSYVRLLGDGAGAQEGG